MNRPTKIITHTAQSSKKHTHFDVGRWHRQRWGGYRPSRIRNDVARYAGYHIIINWDGTIEQCRAFDEEGIHCKGQNFTSIGVCFMGNNDQHLPSPEQIQSWRQVFANIQFKYPHITPNQIYPHRVYANKTCHGKLLSDDYWARQLNDEPQKVQLQTQVIQLLNRLYTLLMQERMK